MSSTVRIRYLGHATLLLQLDGLRILTDPLLRPVLGPLVRIGPAPEPAAYRDIDLVLVSHLHPDHLDIGSLRLLGGRPTLVVPKGAGSLLAHTQHRAVVEALPGETLALGGLTIRTTHAEHPGSRRPGGLPGVAMGYVVEGGARRIYFAGDTDLFPAMADLDRPDIALIPVGGWGLTRGRGHLDPRDAAEALTLIRPRVAVPIHWGTFWPRGLGAIRPSRGPGAAGHFARFAGEVAPAVQIAIAQPGEPVPLDEGQAA